MNTSKLDTLHDDKIVILDRISFNLLIAMMDENDQRIGIVKKVLNEIQEIEEKAGKRPCMDIPIKVSDLKRLFPAYNTAPPFWKEK